MILSRLDRPRVRRGNSNYREDAAARREFLCVIDKHGFFDRSIQLVILGRVSPTINAYA
jgi:hypothetical protein